jgi:hypothetical protein
LEELLEFRLHLDGPAVTLLRRRRQRLSQDLFEGGEDLEHVVVEVGRGLLGRVVDALGNPIDGKGPIEAAELPSPLRGYDHHLEALGDFQWRLDCGASLLAPLREEILERGNRLLARTGRLDSDVFGVFAELAGIPRERAARAMSEPAPPDASTFTRTVSDLQLILKSLN